MFELVSSNLQEIEPQNRIHLGIAAMVIEKREIWNMNFVEDTKTNICARLESQNIPKQWSRMLKWNLALRKTRKNEAQNVIYSRITAIIN